MNNKKGFLGNTDLLTSPLISKRKSREQDPNNSAIKANPVVKYQYTSST